MIKRTTTFTTLALAAALLLSSCTSEVAPPPSSPSPSASALSRPVLSSDFVSRIDGSTATIPLMTAALRLLRGTDDGMHFNTTPDAYDNLIAGSKDVIFVTAPSQEELAAAQEAGVELEVIPVVKDALVFLVNTANPVDGLTQQQVKDIYSGKITNWSQVGGADEAIIPYQRQINSGSQTLFLQLAMGDTVPMDAPEEIRPGGMDGLIDVISVYDNSDQALGYSVFYYTQQMYVKDNVKLLAIDGVAPTTETIADGTFPYLTYYYAVVRKDEPADSTARQLIDWCLSDEGQQTFAAASYVPLDPSNIVPPDAGYGYDGSTAENTTQSSGTGGPVGQVAPFVADPCENDNCLLTDGNGEYRDIDIPGFPQATAAVKAWIEALPPVTPVVSSDPNWGCSAEVGYSISSGRGYNTNIGRGLLSVTRAASSNCTTLGQDTAVFRLADGHRMALSDFFYDGVNYIDFINRNLLNESTNQALVDTDDPGGYIVGERTAPFTGLPATTLRFDYNANGNQLTFYFPPDNPFLAANWSGVADGSVVPINLPSDLSPYGAAWQINPVQVGQYTIDHLNRNYQGVDPLDATINQAVDTWVTSQAKGKTAVMAVTFDSTGLKVWVGIAPDNPGAGTVEFLANATFDFETGQRLE